MKGKGTRYQNTRSILFAAVEVGVFTAIFVVAGAWPTPDVNEGYYLAKARHSFNPEWCGNDFFSQFRRGARTLFLSSWSSRGVLFRFLQRLGSGDGRAGWH